LNNNKLHKNSAIFIAVVLVAGVVAISSPFTPFAQNVDAQQTGFCENSNVNLNDVTQLQSQRQQIDSNVKEAPELNAQSLPQLSAQQLAPPVLTPEDALSAIFSEGTIEALLNTTSNIVNVCFNINNNDLGGPTFTGGAGQAQTGTGGAGDTLTGGNTIE
jgi:hypothetical protein